MSRLDKATAERHTQTLRELVKRPENKVCADCKRNDPRWASWNLGVFLCIRCSGIHRGMGTHISKVKSVDLDMWTPEQMDSILKWGNRRANLYWEARLKVGHVPPDHKMESFVRSKYETRRWAMDGPLPSDPSILEDASAANTPDPVVVQQQTTAINHTSRPSQSSVSGHRAAPQGLTTRQPQPHQLLSTAIADRTQQSRGGPAAAASQAPLPPPEPKAPQNDLFSLDFHAPVSQTTNTFTSEPKKDKKNDILSLFSTPAPPAQHPSAFGQFGGHLQQQQQDPWGAFSGSAQPQQHQPAPPTSMMGSNGVGQWGVSSGWNASHQVVPPPQGNLWGNSAPAPAQQFGTSEMWATPAAPSVGGGGDLFSTPFASTTTTQKKDDAFGDLWGGFK